jgi:NAD-dependent dihydropyrimidine dehydrogenase PreA subunit
MKIDREKCVGCGSCVPVCPVGAIALYGDSSTIDQDECVECGTCLRVADCPVDAIFEPPEVYTFPRSVRKYFSDPTAEFLESTGLAGRGTAEAKTNDVTGRVKKGQIGIGIEMGRPGKGAWVRDIEKVTRTLSQRGFRDYESENPLTQLLDKSSGRFKPEVMGERVLSAIIEMKVTAQELPRFLGVVKEVSEQIDTVFSLQLCTRLRPDLQIPPEVVEAIKDCGFTIKPGAKINMGMGRPLMEG